MPRIARLGCRSRSPTAIRANSSRGIELDQAFCNRILINSGRRFDPDQRGLALVRNNRTRSTTRCRYEQSRYGLSGFGADCVPASRSRLHIFRIGDEAHLATKELDINPLLAVETGVITLDARLRIEPSEAEMAGPNPNLAIRPYPNQWERWISTINSYRV